MTPELFVLALGAVLAPLFAWSWRTLPADGWQFLAAVPVARDRSSGGWEGLNLTYYGLFQATGATVAIALFLVLAGAAGAPLAGVIALAAAVLGLCVPASTLIARVVEKKKNTLTVGGAACLGIAVAPFAALALGGAPGLAVPVLPTLAALAIGYAFGEALGRVACVSFGCCYGKPLDRCSPLVRRIFERTAFVFSGATKKIAYAAGLDGRKVVPIQAITSVVYLAAGLAATLLYLRGWFRAAYVLALVVTQGWRVLSELARADHRGGGRLSAYQWMALACVPFAAAVSLALPVPADGGAPIDLDAGLRRLWNPGMLLFLETLFVGFFLYTGRSKVTGATVNFHVRAERI